jgi:hypothetical protein
MKEIWAEHTAQEAAEADGMKPPIIVHNGIQIQPYTIDDWSLSPHLTKWDSPTATKYMLANITCMALTMPHMEEESEEEVCSILDQWPLPPSTPPADDNMHPPVETFSSAHLGEEWEYNTIKKPKYFQFLIPDPSIPCHQIVAPWIKYDLNPVRPSISSTFGKYHSVITCPLWPSPVDYTYSPLTPEQTTILYQDESFLDIIDYIIQEHLLFDMQAGIQQF